MHTCRFHHRTPRAFILTAAALLSTASLGAALITGTTGAVTEIAPPVSVAPGALESDAEIRIFSESSVGLLALQSVDHTGPGFVSSAGTANPGSISAGTTVRTFFVHFDRVGDTGLLRLAGSVTFDMDILGLDFFDATLDTSDGTFGNPGTTYTTVDFRGLEFPSQDTVEVSGDLRTLTVDLATVGAVDHVRVYVEDTAEVPEPSTWLLMGTGLLGLGYLRRRRG